MLVVYRTKIATAGKLEETVTEPECGEWRGAAVPVGLSMAFLGGEEGCVRPGCGTCSEGWGILHGGHRQA